MFKNHTPDTRSPRDVANRIVEILQNSSNSCNRDTAEFLNSELKHWPAEFFKKNLSNFINKNIIKDPDDEVCNMVYAELCNTTPDEIKYILQVFSGQIEWQTKNLWLN